MRQPKTAKVEFSEPIIQAAAHVAGVTNARVVFAYASAVEDLSALQEAVRRPTQLVLVCRNAQDLQRARAVGATTMSVPGFDLTRMGQIKMATLMAFTQQILNAGDVFVFLAGASGHGMDTLVTMRVGEEYELFQSVGQSKFTEHIRRPVFEKVLRLALELAHEGREGKAVGALFVLGDHRDVQKYCAEGRINPFRGYTEKERNVLDDSINETVKEIAKLDGAFILKGNGVIVSACTVLRPPSTSIPLPQGLGARHSAASGITAATHSIAITLSQSTGDVRIWRRGQMITEIEKSSRGPIEREPAATSG